MKPVKLLALLTCAALAAGILAGCGGVEGSSLPSNASSSAASSNDASLPSEASSSDESSAPDALVSMNIAGLKGPTGLGMLKMMDDADKAGNSPYTFTLAGAPDDIVSKISTGELDLAAVPSNLAATLYNKTKGNIRVLAVNALGVLYLVQKNESVASLADLKGKTLIASGKGTAAQYVLEYLLKQNGIDPQKDVTIDYKSEHAEAAAAVASAENAVAVLPQPFVTTVTMQNKDVTVALDLSAEWENATQKKLPMGVIIGRGDFVDANPDAVNAFLDEYAASTAYANEHPTETAALSEQYDLIKASVAEKAIPLCNIVSLQGDDMKTPLNDFLQILFEFEPKSIGGAVPGDDFYYSR